MAVGSVMTPLDLLVLVSVIVGQFVVIPLVGASFLFLCSRKLSALGRVTFVQSWKAYLVAVCCGLGVLICLNLVLPRGALGAVELLALQFAVTCLAHFLVILLRLRRLSHAALLAQACVVMLTNLLSITVMLSVSLA
jgi:hypothetical protein